MNNFRKILRSNIGSVMGTAFLNILTSLAFVFAGYSLSFLFTAYEYEGNKVKALLIVLVAELVIWSAAMGFCYFSGLALAKMRRIIKNELRSMIGNKIAALDYTEFIAKDCGNYVSWLTNDVEQIYEQSFSSLFSGIENFAITIFSLGALFLLSPSIGFSAIILFAVISVLPQYLNKYLQKANEAQSQALEVSVESYKDVIMGGSIFFLSNLRERIAQRIENVSEEAEKVCYQFKCTNVTVQVLIQTVSLLGQVILMFAALLAAALGAASTGAVLSVGNLAGSFFNGAGEFVKALLTVKASGPLWEKFGDESVPVSKKADIGDFDSITLESLSFGYGTHSVIKNQNYTFHAGEKYAVMGESGSGKTTLAKILLGLLPGYSGNVYYGDLEQREADLHSLYDHVAYVDQQVYLFQDTVRFNITLGQPYSDAEIMEILEKCRLKEYVESLPNGLDTVILENGKNLSGGQRQRIALARGLLRKAKFIILDEGTSALDEMNAIDIETSIMGQKELGVILITHHLRDSIKPKLTDIYCFSC